MTCDDDDDDDDYDGGGSSMSVIRPNRKRFWGTLFVAYSVQRHQFMTIFTHRYMVDNNKQTLIMTTIYSCPISLHVQNFFLFTTD